MTSRERFIATINHQQPDRAPIDLACTSLTGMSSGAYKRLMETLGFTGEGQLSNNGIDERLLVWAGCDFRSVGGMPPLRGPLARAVSDTEFVDSWGIRRKLLNGYWEISGYPLAGATREDLAAFPWPSAEISDELLSRWRDEARRLTTETPYVVIGEHPVLGILELGCWMCGYDDFLLRMAMEPEFIQDFFDRYYAIQSRVIDQYYGALAGYLDLTMSGDDFGSQSGPLMSPAMFEEMVAPCFKERIAKTKALGKCLYWHHSCGAVTDLLDILLGCGVDLLNPVQTSAAGMSPARLKAGWGDKLTFWGAVDTQVLLRTGTEDEVRAAVREVVSVLGQNGGYVAAPAHNLQDDIPAANIIAMVETVRS